MIELIISGVLSFISQIKPWLIWYILSEGNSLYKGTRHPLAQYLIRFGLTLWVLYWATLFMDEFNKAWEIYMFSAGFFSLFLLDIYDKFGKDKIDNLIDLEEKKIWKEK